MLYGSSINPSDPDCELLSLYPVKAYRKRLYDKKQGLRRLGEKTEGKFCSLEFPETLKLWEQELCSDELVMKVAQPRHSFPKYEHSKPLQVVYTTAKNQQKLKKEVFGAAVAPNLKALEKCLTRAANLNGCLLQDIARRGRLKKVALVLAINDTLGPDGACWPSLENATRRVISHFIQAVIVAGLPSVYPHNSDEDDEDDEGEESDSSEEELDETSDDEQPSTSGVNSSGESGFATSNSSFKTAPRVKEGIPTDDELHELAHDVKSFWKKLGRELKVENPMLAQFDLDNPNDSYEKAYQMLTHWRESNADSATYQILFEALNSRVVGRRDLAKKYCEAT